jgi:transposase
MIRDFDDFSLWVYFIVDEIWQQLGPHFRRPGPAPRCSDSELIAMSLIGECRGWDQETDLLSAWREHRDLFPHQPSQSRFNRRRRQLATAFNWLRRALVQSLELARESYCLIDSLPLPVVQFHYAPQASREWAVAGATFGKVPSKKATIYGFKLHLLTTVEGLILDFELAPANVADIEVGFEMLAEHTDLDVLGDKAYVGAAKRAELRTDCRVNLRALPRRNQRPQPSRAYQQYFNARRQVIETVNSQLAEQFNIERNHAHTFWGLCTRLHTKLTAHTLSIYLNRRLDNPPYLQIKKLAFPN